jgi:hypothetical protein
MRCLTVTWPTLVLVATPVLALAQVSAEPNTPPPPPEAAPTEAPPPPAPAAEAPPTQPAPAPAVPPPAAAPQPAGVPAGQWVETQQYGWLWIPYGQQYTYVPADPQVFPDQYVYYPAYGWRWVISPWVYGYGPQPYWGVRGVRVFAWYAHPWFRVGGYWGWGGYRGWGHYRGWVGPRVWGPHGWRGAPAYYRTGHGGPHPGHSFRAAPERGRVEHEHRRAEHRGHER